MATSRARRVLSRGLVLLALGALGTGIWALVVGLLVGIPLVIVGVALALLGLLLRRRVVAGGDGPRPGGAGVREPRRPRGSPPALSAEAVPDTAQAASA